MNILIARILGPHGIRGHVKVKSFADDPAAIGTYKTLHTADGKTFTIKKLVTQKDHFIATFAEVEDRNAAEALQGTDLFVARETIGTQEVLLADMIGRELFAGEKSLGVVTGFQNFGAGELAELADGSLVPVRFIEVGEKLTANLPDGFLDPPDKSDRDH